MKLAVISCIHGNSAALNAVLSDIDHHSPDNIYCLGDLVGYGPEPNAVIETIRALNIPTCQGCWDEDIVEGLDACECSYPSLLAEKRGKLAHEWTNQTILSENRQFLAQLPLSLRAGNLCFVHGSPNSQHEYLLPDIDAFTALERVMSAGAEVLFCGHTHVPYVRTFQDSHLQVRLSGQARQFTTPVHQIINTDTQQVTLREVEYDYQATCAAIIKQGLPPIFAWRLARGLEFAERADDPTHICDR
jgi:diadenosine tetraphosphatase ApaH/serine/threonine PP2A family protein phosphatase